MTVLQNRNNVAWWHTLMFLPPTGQVTISGEITFQLDTDPANDPPVFTLTCTSTGGPATTVSWRRDGTMLSDDSNHDITSQVTDTVTATYTNTLIVTGRLTGQYQCNVSNSRTPSGSTRNLTVVGKECSVTHASSGYQTLLSPTVANLPANLNAVKVNSSSFRVSWTPSARTVTGYQVYWSGVGGSDSGNMSVGARDTGVTITGRTPDLTYDVTIVALSDHLPSPVVGSVMVTLGEPHKCWMDAEIHHILPLQYTCMHVAKAHVLHSCSMYLMYPSLFVQS